MSKGRSVFYCRPCEGLSCQYFDRNSALYDGRERSRMMCLSLIPLLSSNKVTAHGWFHPCALHFARQWYNVKR
jgi:hypothetical protein